jgi:hypothetical protein
VDNHLIVTLARQSQKFQLESILLELAILGLTLEHLQLLAIHSGRTQRKITLSEAVLLLTQA